MLQAQKINANFLLTKRVRRIVGIRENLFTHRRELRKQTSPKLQWRPSMISYARKVKSKIAAFRWRWRWYRCSSCSAKWRNSNSPYRDSGAILSLLSNDRYWSSRGKFKGQIYLQHKIPQLISRWDSCANSDQNRISRQNVKVLPYIPPHRPAILSIAPYSSPSPYTPPYRPMTLSTA